MATTANHVLLRRITVTDPVASITFSGIPQTGYTDLKIVASARSTANGGQNMNLTFNSTTSGYSDKILSGNGSAASSFTSGNTARGGSAVMPGADFTANTFGNAEIYIPNYTSGTAKSFSSDSASENNATTSYAQMQATLWTGTAAISTILIDLSGGNFAAGSSFSLYGIADVNTTPKTAPKADGGDIIKTDGTYWYHAFLSSGTFKPQLNLTADVLVVAGGGAGWPDAGGGGGAGGMLAHTSQALASTSTYVCTVGGGGSGAGYSSTSGVNSQFGSLTASIGGGRGGYTGLTGGSGGGSRAGAGAAGTSGQGNAGGTGGADNGGGGGGAGAVGGNGSGYNGGNGGAGLNTYSSWATATGTGASGYYAGGGGGGFFTGGSPGTGGLGGGGNGGIAGTAGTANTGGGGGSCRGGDTSTGAGGSGIIIIRYPV